MVNYDAILYLVSIVLILLILFMILFGCKSNGRRYYEKFSNNDEEREKEQEKEREKEQEKEQEKLKAKQSQEQKNNKNKEEPSLSNFENEILGQLSSGQLTTEAFTNLIANQQFTQTNLENMINFVEYNKGSITNN